MANNPKVDKLMNQAIEAVRKEMGPDHWNPFHMDLGRPLTHDDINAAMELISKTPEWQEAYKKVCADSAINDEKCVFKGDIRSAMDNAKFGINFINGCKVKITQEPDGTVTAVGGGAVSTGDTVSDAVRHLYIMGGLGKDEYTLKEVSERTGLSERTLQRRMKEGLLQAEMKNGKYIISNEELKRFINGHPKYKKRLEKKDEQHALQLMSQKEDLTDKAKMELSEHPENVKLVVESYNLEEQIIELKMKQLQLQMKIYKDHPEILQRIAKEAYGYGARRVNVQNSLNSLNFLTGSTPIFGETDES